MKPIELSAPVLQQLAERFLDGLFKQLSAAPFELEAHWDIDHLCFRVDSIEAYESYKETFSKLGTLLIESDVNGRPISTFELNYPVRYQNWLIRLIELPAPKKGKICKTGFEHIEIVIDISLTKLVAKYPKLSWDQSGMVKLFNSELELPLKDGAVKFHNLSLRSVVNFEKRPKFAMLVTELRLFEIFKDSEPFIAGTIPLSIDGRDADLDFLVSGTGHEEFTKVCSDSFGSCLEFSISQGHANGADYSLCSFLYREVPVEIFSSVNSTYTQNGFLHFQIEEKLLKYGVIDWQTNVIKLKADGLKTEPAFARLLKQEAVDPYKYLLDLQRKPIRELREIIQTATLLN